MSSVWERIVGHEGTIELLNGEVESHSHAYLFVGPPSVGKSLVARAFAAALNCESRGCGKCASCIKVEHGVHPDVHVIEPAGKSEYLTGQIVRRASSADLVVAEEANRTPFEGRRKVFIFKDAEKLSEECSNALLKTLEEPPSDVVFILIADSLASLLPTVVSRCRIVRFFAVLHDRIVDHLVERGFERGDAELASRLSEGLIGEALDFVSSPARLARREAIISAVCKLPDAGPLETLSIAEDLLAAIKGGIEEVKERQRIEAERALEFAPPHLAGRLRKRMVEFHKRAVLREEHKGFEEVLLGFARWYRDALAVAIGAPECVINLDRMAELEFEARKHPRRLLACVEFLTDVRKRAAFNVNMQMTLEAVLFKLQEELAEGAHRCWSGF